MLAFEKVLIASENVRKFSVAGPPSDTVSMSTIWEGEYFLKAIHKLCASFLRLFFVYETFQWKGPYKHLVKVACLVLKVRGRLCY